ncbi:hypothetical protein [Chryseobacterium sp. ERMR1:04]|uniref:hypothetical protein n=1 Tax=Chryseobacterium sp. ERMR1:04 TaxID=1705393 RepID=UPI0006C8398F|nr:hypothetical protein [Chryseobacterium sp. ERMR1:04]KPH14706.1 hypothetical protein AMQ68_04455 [Chryseobacterium sp. ERMR1:04]
MGNFNTTFILLKKNEIAREFLFYFHEKLLKLDISLEKEWGRIIFNDKRNDDEKEPFELKNFKTDEEIIDSLCSWEGLGLLSYKHINIEFPFYINYISWDDTYLQGIEISFKGSAENYTNRDRIKNNVILKIAERVNFQLIVGSMGNSEDDFRANLDLVYNLEYIKDKKFDIDIR